MKRILAILALLAIFAAACTVEKETAKIETAPSAPADEKIYFDSDVRLTAEGFDKEEVNIKAGESLTVMIVDNDLNGHYLAMDDIRLSEKQLNKGGKISIPFDKEGSFRITDETSGNWLAVNVE